MATYSAQQITGDGTRRFDFPEGEGKKDFTIIWDSQTASPAGIVKISVDGDAGKEPGIIDLSAGQRGISLNMRVPLIDVEVTGLPEGGKLLLYCL